MEKSLKILFDRNPIKAIAFYLPQYYRTKENDEWWGEGFTDWVAVQKAEQLIEGQILPRIPLKGYYNLESPKVLRWQAMLAKKYNLYGFCFYHYWFKDGRRTLEKPAELLLKNKDIEMKFCFSWANEHWVRTWSNIKGNTWSAQYSTSQEEVGNSGVLLEQDYGLEKEWREHFEYLLPFFKDDRYIQYEGKPVFIFYRPELIPRLAHMVRCWKKWAVESGLKGLYVIGTIHRQNKRADRVLDAELLHNPNVFTNTLTPERCQGVGCYNYDELWKRYLRMDYCGNKKRYLSGLVNYDITPRKGRRGIVLKGMTPHKFGKYFRKLVKLSRNRGNEFIFVNAWNEWGETMYLEPDTLYGYACLRELKKSL